VLPDLVLLDVMMPKMSGYDVARKIREMYPSNSLPIIMVGRGVGWVGWGLEAQAGAGRGGSWA
jgi:FixJ family two-component response regulator